MELIVEDHISVFSSVHTIENKGLFVAWSDKLVIVGSGVNMVVMMMIVSIWVLNDIL